MRTGTPCIKWFGSVQHVWVGGICSVDNRRKIKTCSRSKQRVTAVLARCTKSHKHGKGTPNRNDTHRVTNEDEACTKNPGINTTCERHVVSLSSLVDSTIENRRKIQASGSAKTKGRRRKEIKDDTNVDAVDDDRVCLEEGGRGRKPGSRPHRNEKEAKFSGDSSARIIFHFVAFVQSDCRRLITRGTGSTLVFIYSYIV